MAKNIQDFGRENNTLPSSDDNKKIGYLGILTNGKIKRRRPLQSQVGYKYIFWCLLKRRHVVLLFQNPQYSLAIVLDCIDKLLQNQCFVGHIFKKNLFSNHRSTTFQKSSERLKVNFYEIYIYIYFYKIDWESWKYEKFDKTIHCRISPCKYGYVCLWKDLFSLYQL